jgi:hypothetical protein
MQPDKTDNQPNLEQPHGMQPDTTDNQFDLQKPHGVQPDKTDNQPNLQQRGCTTPVSHRGGGAAPPPPTPASTQLRNGFLLLNVTTTLECTNQATQLCNYNMARGEMDPHLKHVPQCSPGYASNLRQDLFLLA